jgi:hypothetical protein
MQRKSTISESDSKYELIENELKAKIDELAYKQK